MHLSANIRYKITNQDKERRGLVSASYKMGHKAPLTFGQFIATLIKTACEFAVETGLIGTTEELQAQLNEAFDWCGGLIVEDTPEKTDI